MQGLIRQRAVTAALASRTNVLLPIRAASCSAKLFSTSSNENGDQQQQQHGSPDEVKQLKEKISKLEEDLKTMKQEVLYAMADQENTRRIARKDVADAKAYGIKEFAKGMIDVADILQKAVESMSSYEIKDPVVKSMVEGVKATEQNLLKAFKSNGVQPYGAQGDKFDPNIHEALAKVPDAHHPPNTLYQVLRRGWMLNNRVLRAAQAAVSIAPPEVDSAFLERKLRDQVDEADELERLKAEKLKTEK